MKKPIPPEHIEKSIRQILPTAKNLIDLLDRAIKHSKKEIQQPPIGGKNHFKAEHQVFPSFVRVRLHQLIEGTNSTAVLGHMSEFKVMHVRNGAVCLLADSQQLRVLKFNEKYPTRPTGKFQRAMIEQQHYFDYVEQSSLDLGLEPPLLNVILYYETHNLELSKLEIVVSEGFDDRSRIKIIFKHQLEVENPLDQLATFEADLDTAVLKGLQTYTFVSLDELDDEDPYAAEETVTDEIPLLEPNDIIDVEEKSNE